MGTYTLRGISCQALKLFTSLVIFTSVLIQKASASGLELSLTYAPNLSMNYEGEGARENNRGWESQTHFNTSSLGIIARKPLSPESNLNFEFWSNQEAFHTEESAILGPNQRQFSNTSIRLDSIWFDWSHYLANSNLEFAAGLNIMQANLTRASFILDNVPLGGSVKESITGQGIHFGLSRFKSYQRFYNDWKILIGHILHTSNLKRASSSVVTREGLSYNFHLETGARLAETYLVGIGIYREMWHPQVTGGKTEIISSQQVIVSYPQNKFVVQGIYLRLGHEF